MKYHFFKNLNIKKDHEHDEDPIFSVKCNIYHVCHIRGIGLLNLECLLNQTVLNTMHLFNVKKSETSVVGYLYKL